jgi:hypothetical protein
LIIEKGQEAQARPVEGLLAGGERNEMYQLRRSYRRRAGLGGG